MNLTAEIRKVLQERTATAEEINAKIAMIDRDIKSGDYSQERTAKLIMKRGELRQELEKTAAAAERDAKQIVMEYQEELRQQDCLDPSELTDDVKLLSSGLNLLPRDIEAIISRNEGNRTMTQLAVRYAKDHDIEIQSRWAGNEQAIREAEQYNYVIDVYTSHWIASGKGLEMLDKFIPQETE